MTRRKTFLSFLAAAPALLGAAPQIDATDAPEPSAEASPTSQPSIAEPHHERHRPSPEAVAVAMSMRRFDATLADADVDAIAVQIDGNRAAAAALDPRRLPLRNGEEPVTTFAVRPR